MTSPEQSKTLGPVAPNTHGRPSFDLAIAITWSARVGTTLTLVVARAASAIGATAVGAIVIGSMVVGATAVGVAAATADTVGPTPRRNAAALAAMTNALRRALPGNGAPFYQDTALSARWRWMRRRTAGR